MSLNELNDLINQSHPAVLAHLRKTVQECDSLKAELAALRAQLVPMTDEIIKEYVDKQREEASNAVDIANILGRAL